MRKAITNLLVAGMFSLILTSSVRGQQVLAKSTLSKSSVNVLINGMTGASPEEKVIRAAYEKLTKLNKAALRKMVMDEEPPSGRNVIFKI